MSAINIIKRKVHSKVHFFEMKKKYSIHFDTGGIRLENWSEHSPEEQAQALKKDWFVRWSYRVNGKLMRQNNIKLGVNTYKTKRERVKILQTIKEELENLLNSGWNPYEEAQVDAAERININEAVNFALKQWQNTISENSFRDYKSRITQFQKWLIEKGIGYRYIDTITKKIIITYLNEVLQKTSPKNRNNRPIPPEKKIQYLFW